MGGRYREDKQDLDDEDQNGCWPVTANSPDVEAKVAISAMR